MLLKVRNLSCSLSSNKILSQVSFSIDEGELVSLVGANGAGKSTLIRCILGIIPFAGKISFWPDDSGPISISDCSRADLSQFISWVPQTVERVPHFSVWDFVSMGRYGQGKTSWRDPAKEKELVSMALEITGTMSLKKRFVDSLSSGEIRLVMLAAALAQDTKMILLDEPGSHLDPGNEVALYEVIRGVNDELGKAMLMVGHDINKAASYSDQVVALRDGEICFSGAPDSFISKDVLSRIYGTEFAIVLDDSLDLPIAVSQ